jgi:hypothetical protein
MNLRRLTPKIPAAYLALATFGAVTAAAVLLAFATLLASALPAQAQTSDSLSASRMQVHAMRCPNAVSVDGVLNEAVWQQAVPVTEFTQRDPIEGAKPTQKTEVRVAYDDDALYIGARMFDTAPDSILCRLTRRDVSVPADHFVVFLDPFYDRRSGYYFMINAAGTLYDGALYNDGWDDSSWDGVWEASAKVDAQGWVAEMRIPYSQLRFQRADSYRWGIDFRRNIQRRNEQDWLVYQPKKGSGFVSRFPDLVGIESVEPGRSVELTPYVTTKAEYLIHDAVDPFNDGSRYVPDGGADLRMGVGSRLTLNATVNPDFGQVEVDPAVVNLSDTESFFQEKRPFFVEGGTIFHFGNQGANDYWSFNWPEPTFFYTRRIGRNPQGALPNADYYDVPVGTSILGAAKLTGKLSPTWNFGTMHALTAREHAKLWETGTRSEQEVEPLTYYGVMRAQKEFKKRQQGLGIMGTLVERQFDDPTLRDQLSDQSAMVGLDGWTFLDKKQVWVISGWSAMSTIQGTSARMTTVQQNSRHYFQRPDANHVEVDPNATSLTGYGSRFWLNKQSGSLFLNSAVGFMDPKFEVNDMGFQSRADVINGHFGTGWKWTETTKNFKYRHVLGAVFGAYDFQGNPTSAGVWSAWNAEFANNYSWQTNVSANPQTVNTRLTRGGPRMLNLPSYEIYNYFDTDGKKKMFYFIESDFSQAPESKDLYFSAFPGVEWKPASNLTLRVGPGYERNVEKAHYLQTQTDPAATQTYDAYYVFGHLDQTTYSAQVRLNCAMTPKLSLQLFAQPLISTGHYSEFKTLAEPRSFDFDPLAVDGSFTAHPAGGAPFTIENSDFGTSGNPDFNVLSLRGNAVLRWEYMPGSTLFLVWTQERSDFENEGEFDFNSSAKTLANTPMNNIFLAKVTYYFSL